MRFVETPLFTAEVGALLSDEEFRELQWTLLVRPEAGRIIRGSGGVRKIRWRRQGHGKRGGLRVIYHWRIKDDVIYLLLIYSKAQQDDLTPQQLRVLRELVQENL